jgi:DNA repair protein RadD
VEEGYLAKLITKATHMKMNVDDIKIRAKDFAVDQLSRKFDRESITEEAVQEIIEYGHNYKKWLLFAIDISHAEHITKMLNKYKVTAAVVHSRMDADRDKVVKDFRNGNYRAVVNVDILTTGLNIQDIDLIAILRPTQSPVIHVQTIGRGLRPYPGKKHCLVLDFAGNTARLGPINDVVIKQKTKGPGTGQQIVKECPKCMALHPPATKVCDVCGHQFVFKVNIAKTAGVEEVVRTNIAQWHRIEQVTYTLHQKVDKTPSMKVTYRVGLQTFNEWVCFAHKGYPKYKADNWVRQRAPKGMPFPTNLTKLLEYAPWLNQPSEVLVNFSDKFPQIKDCRFQHESEYVSSDTKKSGVC